ncbi:hypothetical protein Thivi_2334 [Thiocystis violascens DSM 198]|uniref:Uncharacterized protein n=1 Tax=Thiocystis violascens (strain ATCC 17096 / DSM 198 / 6111) TaxID=765911 RepID=I3YBB2_THIV6|nr:hypothetical protein Thivi_2334 [Thiocystis violascens DSM 198]
MNGFTRRSRISRPSPIRLGSGRTGNPFTEGIIHRGLSPHRLILSIAGDRRQTLAGVQNPGGIEAALDLRHQP